MKFTPECKVRGTPVMSMSHGKMYEATNDYVMHYDDDDYNKIYPTFCPVCGDFVARKDLLEHAMKRDDVDHAVYCVHQS